MYTNGNTSGIPNWIEHLDLVSPYRDVVGSKPLHIPPSVRKLTLDGVSFDTSNLTHSQQIQELITMPHPSLADYYNMRLIEWMTNGKGECIFELTDTSTSRRFLNSINVSVRTVNVICYACSIPASILAAINIFMRNTLSATKTALTMKRLDDKTLHVSLSGDDPTGVFQFLPLQMAPFLTTTPSVSDPSRCIGELRTIPKASIKLADWTEWKFNDDIPDPPHSGVPRMLTMHTQFERDGWEDQE
jgi:hypothetical protein